jgi:hypothetical protein
MAKGSHSINAATTEPMTNSTNSNRSPIAISVSSIPRSQLVSTSL